MDTCIKVCIAEDHKLFRESLIDGLKLLDNINVLFGAENGQELLDKLECSKPDIIILDINMPVMSGLVALPKIKSKYPEIKVIMFSTYYDKLFILDS